MLHFCSQKMAELTSLTTLVLVRSLTFPFELATRRNEYKIPVLEHPGKKGFGGGVPNGNRRFWNKTTVGFVTCAVVLPSETENSAGTESTVLIREHCCTAAVVYM